MPVIEDSPLNIELFRFINSAHTRALDVFFLYFSYLGTGWVLLPVLAFLLIKKNWKTLRVLALAVTMETLVVWSLKGVFTQPRPASLLKGVHLLVPLHSGSFPSGDTALAFVLAVVFGLRAGPLVRVGLLIYAFLIGYGRLYLGVHFPLDVISGAIIGLTSGVVGWKVLK